MQLTAVTEVDQILNVEDEGCNECRAKLISLKDAQETASVYEKSAWERRIAVRDDKEVWISMNRHFVAPLSVLTKIIQHTHCVDHVCKGGESKKASECMVDGISYSHGRQNTIQF